MRVVVDSKSGMMMAAANTRAVAVLSADQADVGAVSDRAEGAADDSCFCVRTDEAEVGVREGMMRDILGVDGPRGRTGRLYTPDSAGLERYVCDDSAESKKGGGGRREPCRRSQNCAGVA